MRKRYLAGVAYLCETPKYAFALGLGVGLLCMAAWFWKGMIGFGLFFGLVAAPLSSAITHLERIGAIRRHSDRIFMIGAVSAALCVMGIFIARTLLAN